MIMSGIKSPDETLAKETGLESDAGAVTYVVRLILVWASTWCMVHS